jgi:hypothetical protein
MPNRNVEILNTLGPRFYFSTSTITEVFKLKPESSKFLQHVIQNLFFSTASYSAKLGAILEEKIEITILTY